LSANSDAFICGFYKVVRDNCCFYNGFTWLSSDNRRGYGNHKRTHKRTHKGFAKGLTKGLTNGLTNGLKNGLAKGFTKDSLKGSQMDSQKDSLRTHKRIHKRTHKRTHYGCLPQILILQWFYNVVREPSRWRRESMQKSSVQKTMINNSYELLFKIMCSRPNIDIVYCFYPQVGGKPNPISSLAWRTHKLQTEMQTCVIQT